MENYRPSENDPTERLVQAAERLGYEALMEVEERYGSGLPSDDKEPTVQDLAYHNLQHSWRVYNAAKQLASKHGLSEYDTALAALIAASHDVIHEPSQEKTAEELSVEWLVGKMEAEGFNDEDREIARLAILGTAPLLDTHGAYMGQQFILMNFPSVRAGEIALCVAAADMEAVFANYGPITAHDLYKERRGIGSKQDPETLDGLIEFQRLQIQFVRDFQPLYPDLEQFFGGLRQPILEHHQTILDDLLANRITTWEEVLARDAYFMATTT